MRDTARGRVVGFCVTSGLLASLWVYGVVRGNASQQIPMVLVVAALWIVPGVIQAVSGGPGIAGWVTASCLYAILTTLGALAATYFNNWCLGTGCVPDPHRINGLLVLIVLATPVLVTIGTVMAIAPRDGRSVSAGIAADRRSR